LEEVIPLIEEDAGDAEIAIVDSSLLKEGIELGIRKRIGGLTDIAEAVKTGFGIRIGVVHDGR
jgi:hypothetical protein